MTDAALQQFRTIADAMRGLARVLTKAGVEVSK